MARRNKKVIKLRHYRDRLLERITDLETEIREHQERLSGIRKALTKDDYFRAYAIASDADVKKTLGLGAVKLNEVFAELALVYRQLSVERGYTKQLAKAVNNKDWIRVLALCEDHRAEAEAHDKQLTRWSLDHGFTRQYRRNE